MERTVLFGGSEGGPVAILFASLHPERVAALFLQGAYAHPTWASYGLNRYAATPEEFWPILERGWGTDLPMSDVLIPSLSYDAAFNERFLRWCRLAASPSAAPAVIRMSLAIDVRPLLATIQCPTVVFHAHGDRLVPLAHAREMTAAILGAKLVAWETDDHAFIDFNVVVDELERLLPGIVSGMGTPTTRVLSTVVFTDIVESTLQPATCATTPGGWSSTSTTPPLSKRW